MKSQAVKQLVKKIFSDEKIKQQFLSNPEMFLSQYSLSEQEIKAVLSVHSKVGIVTSDTPQMEAAIKPNITWFSGTP